MDLFDEVKLLYIIHKISKKVEKMNTLNTLPKIILGCICAALVATEPLINTGTIDLKRDWYKLVFASCVAIYSFLGGSKSDIPGAGPLKVILLALAIGTTAAIPTQAKAQGANGTINVAHTGNTVTGNTGDIQFQFGQFPSTQSGFNYNPVTKTLLVDSLPLTTVAYQLTVDTTSATGDTIILKPGYLNLLPGGYHSLVLEMPAMPIVASYKVVGLSKVASVEVIKKKIDTGFKSILPATQYLAPTLWEPYPTN